jgi:AcrR family transcriptional regulator
MRPENSPDGRSRSFIEEARRRQIIAAAVEVIAEHGYAQASLARIAKHAGISKGVISYHFDGKDDLMSQVVTQLFVAGAEYMTPQLAGTEGRRAWLRTYIASNLAFIDEHRNFVAAAAEVMLNLRDGDGNLTFVDSGGEDDILTPLVAALQDGQRTGEFGEFDAVITAKLVRDSIDGIANRAVRESDFAVDAYTAELTRMFDLATGTGRER